MNGRTEMTAEARARMEAALPGLREAVVRRGRRRRATRGVLAAGVFAAAGLGAWAGVAALRAGGDGGASARTSGEAAVPPARVIPEPSVPAPAVRVRIVATDPGVAERLTVRGEASRVERMGDAELAAVLKEAGLPRGVLRIGGETIWEGDLHASGAP